MIHRGEWVVKGPSGKGGLATYNYRQLHQTLVCVLGGEEVGVEVGMG